MAHRQQRYYLDLLFTFIPEPSALFVTTLNQMRLSLASVFQARRVASLLLLVAFASISIHAELPPSAYKQMQAKAPERLQLKIISVTQTLSRDEADFKQTTVVVEARVLRVLRSRSRTKRGTTIKVIYTHDERTGGWVGPSPVPIVEEGKTYPAFLTKSTNGEYAPAAGGYTFEQLK